jgi:glycerophosphoryl diester phosphodiesterase
MSRGNSRSGTHPYFASEGPLVIAHRGCAGLAPENTMIGFQKAVEMGADILELDVQSTKDGILVVIHDTIVDRISNGKGNVQDFRIEELKELDAGYSWTDDEGKSFPYRGKGHTIPTLHELFEAYPDQRFNIDIKQVTPSIIEPFGNMIREFGLSRHVLVAAFHVHVIRQFRSSFPQILTAADDWESRWFYGLNKIGLSGLTRLRSQAFQLPEYEGGIHIITDRFVKAAHHAGMQVHVWTIDDVESMQRLISLAVDGIFSNFPDRMLKLLKRL